MRILIAEDDKALGGWPRFGFSADASITEAAPAFAGFEGWAAIPPKLTAFPA
jgi:hypothetical protein